MSGEHNKNQEYLDSYNFVDDKGNSISKLELYIKPWISIKDKYMPCRCGMSDREADDSLKNDHYWEDIRLSIDEIINVLLSSRRLDQIQMDESQAKAAFLKLVQHKLYGCDET